MAHGDFEFWGFKKVEGHYDVINGGQRKKVFFRPEVTFGVDARWLLNRFENGKKITRDRSSGSRLPPFGGTILPLGAS